MLEKVGTPDWKHECRVANANSLKQFRADIKAEPELAPLIYHIVDTDEQFESIYVHDWPLKEIVKRAMKNERYVSVINSHQRADV
jgi:hypothetical protein